MFFFSSFNSQSRGVAVFLNNNFEFKIHKIKRDTDGNKIILDITFINKRFTLINIYGPNHDRPAFFEQIKQDIQDFNNENIILVGDFNLVMNPEADSKQYLRINNPRARDKVLDICAEFSLIDIWRELHMETRQYSWRTNNFNKQARLDFFLITENLFSCVKKAEITAGYRTDHSVITLTLKGTEVKTTKLFWKFNNSLLKDQDYVKTIKKVIEETKKQYINTEANNEQVINNFNNSELRLNINDQLFLDVLLMQIRGKTISFSSYKKKMKDNTEQKLIEEINELEKNVVNNITQQDILYEKKIRTERTNK